jgi:N-acetylmuramoyl-L-alanine amidase
MPYTISEDKLDNVELVTTPNSGGILKPRFVVIHYTAGPSLAGAVRGFKDPKRQVSAHLVIDRDGKIVQVVPFNRVAWHAGKSSWKPESGGRVKGLNTCSIGIELVNAGPLTFTNGKGYFTWWGKQVDPPGSSLGEQNVVEVDPSAPGSFHRRFWHRFPEEQITACLEVAEALVEQYKLEDILGHSDIAPTRKQDPGPAFPLAHIRSVIFGRA